MMVVGRLLKFFEARYLVLCGLSLSAATLYQMVYFTTDTSTQIIVVTCIQGPGLGLVFVPLSMVSFSTLPGVPADQRHVNADPAPQHRQFGRHPDRDRQPHQHDDA